MNEKRRLIARMGFAARPPEGQPELGLAVPPSGATEEHMRLINAMPQVIRPLTAADVYVRGIMAANDLPMQRNWMIEAAGVVRIAELAPGVPIMFNHDEGWAVGRMALPAGRLFAGGVVIEKDGSTWAKLLGWFPATEANTELVQMMDAGAVAEVSVSVGYDLLECTICNTDLFECAHIPGEIYEGKKCYAIVRGVNSFRENSIAWRGDVQGTRFFMAAADTEVLDTAQALEERAARLAQPTGIGALFSPESHDLEALFTRG